jgi:LPS sulfotransferase NodH
MIPPCWIITAPRSGSNLLCELLNSTGLFEPQFLEHYDGRLCQYYVDLFEFPRYNKLMRYMLWGKDYQAIYSQLTLAFPDIRFVHLVRKDVVKQAVSKYFSIQTGMWYLNKGNYDKYQELHVPYSYDKILMHLKITERENDWSGVFLSEPERIFTVYYEDLVSNTQVVMSMVADFIGFSGDFDWELIYKNVSETRQIVNSHPKKQEYLERFLRTLKCQELFSHLSDLKEVPSKNF